MNDLQPGLSPREADAPPVSRSPIGRLLVDQGKIELKELHHALKLQKKFDAPLGDIMISEGLIEKKDVLRALSKQVRTKGADLQKHPPAPEMAGLMPAETCLRFGVVPWKEDPNALYIATSSPSRFSALSAALGPQEKPLFPVIVDEAQISTQLSRLHGTELAQRATLRTPAAESCRTWQSSAAARSRWCFAVLFGLLALTLNFPLSVITAFMLIAALTLFMVSLLKLAAVLAFFKPMATAGYFRKVMPTRTFWRPKPVTRNNTSNLGLLPIGSPRTDAALRLVGGLQAFKNSGIPLINADEVTFRLPRVSIMVPLLHEREIAGRLIERLSRLTYPKSLLEVVLVLEAGDALTRETVSRTALPEWMSVIEVPEVGGLTTKPRALNYALDFCKGSVIGVWDAEDWPEADQIEKVVARFREAPDDVVCLQGILDYYNSRSSWISRCFTVEYAMWWRIIMPGIARLGLVVPLGGTTLFFKRQALEELGGWDAHNVTEDADLGVRLARHGYKTELLQTVTREEATSSIWPWIRQRSRWLKGFLVTYFVHMRRPGKLLKELGFWRFVGLQTMFLAAVTQFATAPLLWSFWVTVFGYAHPVEITLGSSLVLSLAILFLASEALTLFLGLVATASRDRWHLILVLPTMMFYFALGAFASYKAIWELVRAPFYWDKTQHGVTNETDLLPHKSV